MSQKSTLNKALTRDLNESEINIQGHLTSRALSECWSVRGQVDDQAEAAQAFAV